MGLQVKGARAGRAGDEVDHLRVLGVAHVDHGDAVAEAVADIGVTAMHHDLDAIAATALVAMADELDVACRDSVHGGSPPRTGHGQHMAPVRIPKPRAGSIPAQTKRGSLSL